MRRTDAGADHRNTELPAHRRFPSRVAIASAFSASSMTLKQCACGIARLGAIEHVGDQVCGVGQVGVAAVDVARRLLIDQERDDRCPAGRRCRCTCAARCSRRCRGWSAGRRPSSPSPSGVYQSTRMYPWARSLRSSISPKSSSPGSAGLAKLPTVEVTISASVEPVKVRNCSTWWLPMSQSTPPYLSRWKNQSGRSVPVQPVRPETDGLHHAADRAGIAPARSHA